MKHVIVFQNSEILYWKLAERGKEQTADVVRISPRKYCILNTPPWIKLQTFLNWLEKGGDLLLTPKGTWTDEEEVVEYVDFFHQIHHLIYAISEFFNLKKKGLDQFQLFTAEEVEFIDFMKEYMKDCVDISLKELELIRGSIIYDGICLCPEKNVMYVSNITINKVSEKTAQMMAFKISGYYPRFLREGDKDFFYSM